MPLQETSGAASYDAFGGGLTAAVNYIEDVFSTWLYTGNGSTQTITNGIDLSGKGGLVWIKSRSNAYDNNLQDTARGMANQLFTNSTSEQVPNAMVSANANGFSINSSHFSVNTNTYTYASWAFRKAPKFFDIVTWTGNGGTSGRTITHNLGSAPGCIIVKKTSNAEDWYVYHRSLGNNGTLQYFCILNSTAAQDTGGFGMEKASNWTATQFALASGTSALNTNGATYVAYLFAHDAGGFGASGTDNVISCGSYTGVGSTQQDITLGYEPQWLMIKRTDTTDQWVIVDNMRGLFQTADNALCANNANAEAATVSMSGAMQPTATGFHLYNANSSVNASGGTYIYIAIRRGPMRTPTTGTSVFSPIASSAAAGTDITTNFIVDLQTFFFRSGTDSGNTTFSDRLRGFNNLSSDTNSPLLRTASTAAETTTTTVGYQFWNTGWRIGSYYGGNSSVFYSFRRAPGFCDVVCYTGTGSAQTLSHNLGVTPEFMIVKWRTGATGDNWNVYHSAIGATGALYLNKTDSTVGTAWNNTAPTATQFTVGTQGSVSAATYVAYLFATVAGVSKVGSYTGTGTTLQVNCGFTAGSRFVLIKRTDSTGDWYVWDSARGIVAGNDPYLLLNSTAAEVTSTDYVDTYNAGFEISSTAPAAINANGGTYIFWAIA